MYVYVYESVGVDDVIVIKTDIVGLGENFLKYLL